jgi:hypothetical protein
MQTSILIAACLSSCSEQGWEVNLFKSPLGYVPIVLTEMFFYRCII